MASSLVLSTGPLTARRDWTNDTKVQTALLQFWQQRIGVHLGEGEPEPSNAQKLEQVLDELVRHVLDEIEGQELQQRTSATVDTIRQAISQEYDFRG